MGINGSKQYNSVRQSSVNDFLQISNSQCLSDCKAITSGATFSIGANATVGDITIENTCTSEASCSMKTELKTLSTTQLESLQSNAVEDKRSFWQRIAPHYDINIQTNITDQSMRNTITQVMSSSCEANSSTLIENINVSIGKNATVKSFAIINNASANASCAIENLATLENYTAATATQDNSIKMGGFPLIVIIIMIIVIIGVMAYMGSKNVEGECKPDDTACIAKQELLKLKTQQFINAQRLPRQPRSAPQSNKIGSTGTDFASAIGPSLGGNILSSLITSI
jgi:hypothetical protein